MSNPVNRIRELELLFSANHYNGDSSSAFIIEKGKIPVMLSAPHAVSHFRNGETKGADLYTGGIVRYLHEMTGCHVVYACNSVRCDPNFDPPDHNMYQDAVKAYVMHERIPVLLDIHGAARSRDYAVEMGTAPVRDSTGTICIDDLSLQSYRFISDEIRRILELNLEQVGAKQVEVWKNVIFDAGEQNTVTKYIAETTQTACVQLEINRCYRDPEDEKLLESLIRGMIQIINLFARVDWNRSDDKMVLRE